jgi:Domain of unknown function (DUF4252)
MNEQDMQEQEPAVKLTHPLTALAACAVFLVPATGTAAGPQLKIPDFSHLRSKAVESTDITIDGLLLSIAKKFARHEEDDEALSILSDIKSVRVRNFEFDTDNAYSRADVESVRSQLSAPGWSPVVQSHQRDDQEDVDVYLNIDDGKVMGVAVVAIEPRSFTIVNIVGNIDIEKLAKIEGQLGISNHNQAE